MYILDVANNWFDVKLHPTMTPLGNALIDCFRKTISQLKGVTVGRETNPTKNNYSRVTTIRCRTCVLVSLIGAYSHILSLLVVTEGPPFVFPAEFDNLASQGTEKVWRKVRVSAGMPELRMHDLLHSFASAGPLAGDNLAIIGKLLGHADVKTTARYAHLADDPLRQAATSISNSIASAMEGGSAKVINLRKTKP